LIIWGLKCVGYNYGLEKYLADHLPEASAAVERSDRDKGLEQRYKKH